MQHLKVVDRKEQPASLVLALEFYYSFQADKYIAQYVARFPAGYLLIFTH